MFENSAKAFSLIEAAINDGHDLGTLPLPKERVIKIIEMKEQATELDVQRLEATLGLKLAAPEKPLWTLTATRP
jgi:hypothetical protein